MTGIDCPTISDRKVGIIGFGSMGRMLVNGFINSGKLSPADIVISTRTRSKLDSLHPDWRDLYIAQDNPDAIKRAKTIFLCVKPYDVKAVLDEIKDTIGYDTHIISTAGSVQIESIENTVCGQVSKLTPTVTSEVNEGISLLCHGSRVSIKNREFAESLLNQISIVKILPEQDFEVAAEVTSCGPGLLSAVLQEFVHSAGRHTCSFENKDIEEMLMKTLFGLLKLYCEKNMSLGEIMERVATKGGITEEGIMVLKQGLPHNFDRMFTQMLDKRKNVNTLVNSQF